MWILKAVIVQSALFTFRFNTGTLATRRRTLKTLPSGILHPPFWLQKVHALQLAVALQLSQQAPTLACTSTSTGGRRRHCRAML